MFRYRHGDLLGEGGSAFVYQTSDRQFPALKLVAKQSRSAETDSFIRREYLTLSAVRSNFFPKVYALQRDESGRAELIEERIEGHALQDAWSDINPSQRYDLATQLFAALAGLAACQRRHSDIKPDNLVVGHNGNLKLIDFGLSVEYTQAPIGGTPEYMAPESLQGLASPTADIYSAALTIAALIEPKILTLNFHERNKMLDQLPKPWGPILRGAFVDDPSRRATAAEMVELLVPYLSDEQKTQIDSESFSILPELDLEQIAVAEGRNVIGGLSGSGRTRMLRQIELALLKQGANVFAGGILDGRSGRASVLGFDSRQALSQKLTAPSGPSAILLDDVPEHSQLDRWSIDIAAAHPQIIWVQVGGVGAAIVPPALNTQSAKDWVRQSRPLRPNDTQFSGALLAATEANPRLFDLCLTQCPGELLGAAVHQGHLSEIVESSQQHITQQISDPEVIFGLSLLALSPEPLNIGILEKVLAAQALTQLTSSSLVSATSEGLVTRELSPKYAQHSQMLARIIATKHPGLLLSRASAALLDSDAEKHRTLLEMAAQQCEAENPDLALRFLRSLKPPPLKYADLLARIGHHQAAEEQYRAHLPNPYAIKGAALCLMRQGDYSQARAMLEQHQATDTESSLYGRALAHLGHSEIAQRFCRRALSETSDPETRAGLLRILGLTDYQGGRLQEATEWLQEAKSLASPGSELAGLIDATLAMVYLGNEPKLKKPTEQQ